MRKPVLSAERPAMTVQPLRRRRPRRTLREREVVSLLAAAFILVMLLRHCLHGAG